MANEPLPRPTLPMPPASLSKVLTWARDMVRVLTQFLNRINQRLNASAPVIGSWSPGISADTVAGTVTYDFRHGRWTLQDDEVTVWGDVRATAWSGSPSGNLRVHGLPFINANVNPQTACIVIMHEGVDWPAGYTQALGNIQTNSQNIRFYVVGDGVTSQLLQASNVTPPVRVQVFATYRRQFDEPTP